MTIVEMEAVLAYVSFRNWAFRIGDREGPHPWLQACWYDAGSGLNWHGRKWLLSHHMTKSELVQTAMAAVLMCVEHEAREDFTYRGVKIFGPHHDVDELSEFVAGATEDRRDDLPRAG